MKKTLLLLIACCTIFSVYGQSFKTAVKNPFNLTPTVSFMAQPSFADIDDDGDLDAFGYHFDTATQTTKDSYQENIGSKSSPSFGTVQYNPFGLNTGALKQFIDLDYDGDYDLMTSGLDQPSRGQPVHILLYHENIGTKTSAQFTTVVKNPFCTNGGSMFSFVDLDDDGDMDMMSGSRFGDFFYNENIGSKTNPCYTPGQWNPFGLAGAGSLYEVPMFSDIDGDGDYDMMTVDHYGDFHYYKNTGTKATPTFSTKSTNPFGLTNMQGQTSFTFTDLDNDGDDDIMVGDYNGDLYYFENASGITVEEFTLYAEINLYPNPTSDVVNVDLTKKFQYITLEITSLSGQLILQKNFTASNKIKLSISDFESGIYFVKIITENKMDLKKLVIE